METWRDIVAEMRGMREFYGAEYRALADRIEAACKTLEENERIVIQSAQARHNEEVNALKCENAKMRCALEPVMDVVLGGSSLTDSYEAVRDAQAIMKCEK